MDQDDVRNLQAQIDELKKQVKYLSDQLHVPYSTGIRPTLFEPRLQEAIQKGDKIGAIKVYRELTNCDLLEAKNAVEDMWNTYH
jgi:ribosomal protein L7/L12